MVLKLSFFLPFPHFPQVIDSCIRLKLYSCLIFLWYRAQRSFQKVSLSLRICGRIFWSNQTFGLIAWENSVRKFLSPVSWRKLETEKKWEGGPFLIEKEVHWFLENKPESLIKKKEDNKKMQIQPWKIHENQKEPERNNLQYEF